MSASTRGSESGSTGCFAHSGRTIGGSTGLSEHGGGDENRLDATYGSLGAVIAASGITVLLKGASPEHLRVLRTVGALEEIDDVFDLRVLLEPRLLAQSAAMHGTSAA